MASSGRNAMTHTSTLGTRLHSCAHVAVSCVRAVQRPMQLRRLLTPLHGDQAALDLWNFVHFFWLAL